MKISAPFKIVDDYMQHYMDATDEHTGKPGSHSSSFFDKKVFVNIMNFARVVDCMLSMSASDNLL